MLTVPPGPSTASDTPVFPEWLFNQSDVQVLTTSVDSALLISPLWLASATLQPLEQGTFYQAHAISTSRTCRGAPLLAQPWSLLSGSSPHEWHVHSLRLPNQGASRFLPDAHLIPCPQLVPSLSWVSLTFPFPSGGSLKSLVDPPPNDCPSAHFFPRRKFVGLTCWFPRH